MLLDVEARLRAAKDWVSASGVDTALLAMLREMRQWPAVPAAAKEAACRQLGLDDVEARQPDTTRGVDVRFALRGTRYRFLFEESWSRWEDRNSWGTIHFEVGGTRVVTLVVMREPDERGGYADFRLVAVERLTPGAWAAAALEVESRIRLADQNRQLSWRAQYARPPATALRPPSAP